MRRHTPSTMGPCRSTSASKAASSRPRTNSSTSWASVIPSARASIVLRKRFRNSEMVSAVLGAFQSRQAGFFGVVETAALNPDQRQIERQHILNKRIVARNGDAQRPLEGLDGALIVSKLGIEHPKVVQHPGDGFVIVRSLECAKAVRVTCFGGDEIPAHVEQHATILLDHPQQPYVGGPTRVIRGLVVEFLTLAKIAAPLRDDRQTVITVRLGADRTAFLRLYETLGVAKIRGLGVTLFSMQGALPSQRVGESGQVLLTLQSLDRIVVKTERSCRIASTFCFARLLDEAPRSSRISLRHWRMTVDLCIPCPRFERETGNSTTC